jgi:ATP-dependent DNA helicase DinG
VFDIKMPTETQLRKLAWTVFPFKEEGYREYQEDAIVAIIQACINKKKFAIIEAPTGSGKSVIAYTAAKTIQKLCPIRNERGPYSITAVLTRALQTQYYESFDDMPILWSGSNYSCELFPDDPEQHWGGGQCLKRACTAYKSCEYVNSVSEFKQADIGVTNYSYYLNAQHLSSTVTIIDECHNLEESLCEWMKVEISTMYLDRFLSRLVQLNVIDQKIAKSLHKTALSIIDTDDDKLNWLENLRKIASSYIENIVILRNSVESKIQKLRSGEDPRLLPLTQRQILTTLSRISKYLTNFTQKLMMLVNLKTNWVVCSREHEESKDKKRKYPRIAIKPLSVVEISERFFKRSNFFIMMSATICNYKVMTQYLGIDENECEYIGLPSTFPIKNRPVIAFNDIGKFSYSDRIKWLPIFTQHLDVLIDQFPAKRGIVHSTSYENARYIGQHSRHNSRMRFPSSEDMMNIKSILEERDDTIIISPSAIEGLDLRGDLCRFSIFFKTPWASLGDKWVQARSKDSNWYARYAIIKLVQGSGRGTRSASDQCVTLILDAHFLRLYYRNKNFFPDWFYDAVQIVSVRK